MTKLTRTMLMKIRARKTKGLSNEAIGRELGISKTTVHNAIHDRAGALKPKPELVPTDDPDLPDEAALDIVATLKRFISRQDKAANQAHRKGDQAAAAVAQKLVVSAITALAKFEGPQQTESQGLFVTHQEMEGAAATGLAKLKALANRLETERGR